VISDEGPVGRQVNFVPQSLKRTYALYLDSDEESSNDEPSQNITDVMTSIHSRYPAMNFRQYDGKLKDRGILYLSTAAHFDVGFYKEKIGMSEGAAHTFQSFVAKAYRKVEYMKERRNAKGKKKARSKLA
jgi:hypothetical protein